MRCPVRIRPEDVDETGRLKPSVDLTNVEHLICSGCVTLVELPDSLPTLRVLWCDGCVSLVELPKHMPMLNSLWCDDCVALVELPDNTLRMRAMWCKRCPRLKRFPLGLGNLNTFSSDLRMHDWELWERDQAAKRMCAFLSVCGRSVPDDVARVTMQFMFFIPSPQKQR